LLLVGLVAGSTRAAQPTTPPTEDLSLLARDVLARHCSECHGLDPNRIRKNVNVLDVPHLVKNQVVVPGVPDKSPLLTVITDKGHGPPGKRAKVTSAELDVLRSWIRASAPAFPVVPTLKPEIVDGGEAAGADRVRDLFQTHCFGCHGGGKTTSRASLEILNHDSLIHAARSVLPGNPDASRLYQLVAGKAEPPAGCQARLPPEEAEAVRTWISMGAVPFPDMPRVLNRDTDPLLRDTYGEDYVLQRILEDVTKLDPADRPNVRYFSLNHLRVDKASRDRLPVYRAALFHAVNFLCQKQEQVRPTSIDEPFNTIYRVDLRQLEWDVKPFKEATPNKDPKLNKDAKLNRFDLALLEYPYGVIYQASPTFTALEERFLRPAGLVRPIPYVRGDWFVSRATDVPLYHEFLELPARRNDLETRWLVIGPAGPHPVARVGASALSPYSRAVERRTTARGGYYWTMSYFPMLADRPGSASSSAPAASQMIFTLPNGLQGFFVADGQGARLDALPPELTGRCDSEEPLRAGLSCLRCHAAGLKEPCIQGPAGNALVAELRADNQRFRAELDRLLGGQQTREPLTPASKRYLAPLTLAALQVELGSSITVQNLQGLCASPLGKAWGLEPLAQGGTVKREVWEKAFAHVVADLGLGVPVIPLDGQMSVDGQLLSAHVPDPPLDVEWTTNGEVFHPGDTLHIKIHNRTNQDIWIEVFSAYKKYKSVQATLTRVAGGDTLTLPEIQINDNLGKEQLVFFASAAPFPRGQVIKSTDRNLDARLLHEQLYQLEPHNGILEVRNGAANILKGTREIETTAKEP
jgi:serine/threonine-protein kinase